MDINANQMFIFKRVDALRDKIPSPIKTLSNIRKTVVNENRALVSSEKGVTVRKTKPH